MKWTGKVFAFLLMMSVSGVLTQAAAQEIITTPNVLNWNNGLYSLQWAQSKPLTSFNLFGPLNGTFWRNTLTITQLGLTTDQQQRMDEIFRQHRINLIDLNAAVEKEELILEPLIDALPTGDQSRIFAQIDKVAQARAELEKANSKMLVDLLQVMTPEQVSKLPARGKGNVFQRPYVVAPAPGSQRQ